MRQHFELQTSHHTDHPIGAQLGFEDLGHPFFGEAFQCAAQMFRLHGVVEPHPLQNLRGEIRNAGEDQIFIFGQRVTDPDRTVIGNADNVAGPGFVHQLSVLGKEEDRVVHADRFAGT